MAGDFNSLSPYDERRRPEGAPPRRFQHIVGEFLRPPENLTDPLCPGEALRRVGLIIIQIFFEKVELRIQDSGRF